MTELEKDVNKLKEEKAELTTKVEVQFALRLRYQVPMFIISVMIFSC